MLEATQLMELAVLAVEEGAVEISLLGAQLELQTLAAAVVADQIIILEVLAGLVW